MKKVCYLLLALLLIGCSKNESPREGDIIFQTSKNPEAALIHKATQSGISHCGIIVKNDAGELCVLEVREITRLVPINKFIAGGHENRYTIKRASGKDIKIDYKKYLGCEKDIFLRFGNDKYYNSELVYEIYKEQLGIELCTPRPIHSYNIEDAKGVLQQWRINPNQTVVAPVDLYHSPLLKTVRDTYEKK